MLNFLQEHAHSECPCAQILTEIKHAGSSRNMDYGTQIWPWWVAESESLLAWFSAVRCWWLILPQIWPWVLPPSKMLQLSEPFLSQALFHYLLCPCSAWGEVHSHLLLPSALSAFCFHGWRYLYWWAAYLGGFLVVLEQTGFSEGGTGSCLDQF